jgi:hypothetical protein
MAYREFIDNDEIHWRVWATLPTVGKVLSQGFEKGWLTFESSAARKRLAPIPDGWEEFTDAKLRAILRLAAPTPEKKTR